MSEGKPSQQLQEEISTVTREMQEVAQLFTAFKDSITGETNQLHAAIASSKASAEEALQETQAIEENLTEKLRGCVAIMSQATELAKVSGITKEIECLLQMCHMFMDVSEITKTLLGKHEALVEDKFQLHNSKVLLHGDYLKLRLTTEHERVEKKTLELEAQYASLQKEAAKLGENGAE